MDYLKVYCLISKYLGISLSILLFLCLILLNLENLFSIVLILLNLSRRILSSNICRILEIIPCVHKKNIELTSSYEMAAYRILFSVLRAEIVT